MATVQLLLSDNANRRALASVVADHHTAITKTDFQTADLYIADDASLPRFQEELEAQKREQDPIFCPVVLIRRDRTPIMVDLPDPEPDERPLLVNEVMTAPVEKQALFRRIANLLIRRRQTTELQEHNERLERLASTLRHELRNPLQVLYGFLPVARDTGEADAFERCQTAVDQMERLLEETLLVLKGYDPEIEQEPVDLAALCADCWDMVSEPEAQLEIATTQRISADEDRLRQLLGNLFRNAIEHGGSEVTVTVGELGGGFYIEDDGPGVPEEKHDAVFEEGYSTSKSGTGLGLAVVRAVADVHKWDVQITKDSARGARFEITGVEPTRKLEAP